MKEQIHEFLQSVVHRYSESSLNIHRYGLGKLEQFSQERDLELGEFRVEELAAFHSWLPECGISTATLCLVLRSTKLFLRWAYRKQWTLFDVELYQLPIDRSLPPTPPTVQVMARLLELPDQSIARGLRDRLLLELLYVLGLRRSECCSLSLDDFDFTQATVFVAGKGGDERLLPLSPGLFRTVENYLEHGRPQFVRDPGEQALLLNPRGGRLDGGVLYSIVRKYGRALGLKLRPHQLRHACATHLIEAGMEHDQVQRLLGHRCAKSTQRYTKIYPHELQREFASVHPRAVEDVRD